LDGGVGLASFLLISFGIRLQASKAAIQAMMLNRIGDVGLALGIMTLFYVLKQPIMKPFHTQVCLNRVSQ
jgi:NADH:ubiquinone oxidoreductase subunit 5 (subunit L)/multisubunit Na+/H+ antiporter MnhA subunit